MENNLKKIDTNTDVLVLDNKDNEVLVLEEK